MRGEQWLEPAISHNVKTSFCLWNINITRRGLPPPSVVLTLTARNDGVEDRRSPLSTDGLTWPLLLYIVVITVEVMIKISQREITCDDPDCPVTTTYCSKYNNNNYKQFWSLFNQLNHFQAILTNISKYGCSDCNITRQLLNLWAERVGRHSWRRIPHVTHALFRLVQ